MMNVGFMAASALIEKEGKEEYVVLPSSKAGRRGEREGGEKGKSML
jgi:hypothetical protein